MIVNIYIEISTIAPRALNASGMYLMEALDEQGEPLMHKGEPYVIYEKIEYTHTNTNIMALTMLETALSRLQKPSSIKIYAKCELVYYALHNNWLSEWKNNGWNSARGVGIKHCEHWKKIEYLLNKNEAWTVSNLHHSWEKWMQEKLKDGGKKHVG